jgi:hypothetical protein
VNVAKYETMMGSQQADLVGMKCLTPEGDGEIVAMSSNRLHVVINGVKHSFERLAVNLYLNTDYSRADLLKASGLKRFVNIEGSSVDIKTGSAKSTKRKANDPDSMTDDQLMDELGIDPTILVKKSKKSSKVSPEDLYAESVKFLESKVPQEEPKIVKTKKKKPLPEPTDSETGEPDQLLEVYASNTNGSLCLMLSSEDADLSSVKMKRMLKGMGYHLDPDCWYAEIPNRKVLLDVIEKFEAKFDIPETQLDMLYELVEAFNKGRKKMLDATHSTVHEIREYWLQDNKRTIRRDPKALVPMPVVQDGSLYLMLDMTHESSKRAKRLRIPNLSWESSGGLWMKMYSTKKSCAQDLRALQEYFTIADKEDLKAAITEIDITAPRKRKSL